MRGAGSGEGFDHTTSAGRSIRKSAGSSSWYWMRSISARVSQPPRHRPSILARRSSPVLASNTKVRRVLISVSRMGARPAGCELFATVATATIVPSLRRTVYAERSRLRALARIDIGPMRRNGAGPPEVLQAQRTAGL